MKKGDLARHRLLGKSVLDLGAGMGLCSLALALLGANVISTDLDSILPLLKKNCERNTSSTWLEGLPWKKDIGSIEVKELDWTNTLQRKEFSKNEFDIIVAADCIYNEGLVVHFVDVCLELMNAKTLLIVINELRSESVHSVFTELMSAHFSMKKIPHRKMGDVQHSAINIYYFKKLRKDNEAV